MLVLKYIYLLCFAEKNKGYIFGDLVYQYSFEFDCLMNDIY